MADPTENGKVTLALLGQKMDQVIEKLGALDACVRADHDRLTTLDQAARERDRRIGDVEGSLRARSWENRIEVMVAAALAAFGIARQ